MQACHLQTGALSLLRKGYLPISQRGRARQGVRLSSQDLTVEGEGSLLPTWSRSLRAHIPTPTPNLLLPRVPKPRTVLRSPSPHHSPRVQFSHSCPHSFTELTKAHCVPALYLGHSRDRGSSLPCPDIQGQDLTPGREHISAQMMN